MLIIDGTYVDDTGLKWKIIQKLKNGDFVGVAQNDAETIKKFSLGGVSKEVGFLQTKLKEIEQEWFGILTIVAGSKVLVSATYRTKEGAQGAADEFYWNKQPKVVKLVLEDV